MKKHVESEINSLLTYRKLRKNRPREQNFDARRTSAEVNADSARFLHIGELTNAGAESIIIEYCSMPRKISSGHLFAVRQHGDDKGEMSNV